MAYFAPMSMVKAWVEVPTRLAHPDDYFIEASGPSRVIG